METDWLNMSWQPLFAPAAAAGDPFEGSAWLLHEAESRPWSAPTCGPS